MQPSPDHGPADTSGGDPRATRTTGPPPAPPPPASHGAPPPPSAHPGPWAPSGGPAGSPRQPPQKLEPRAFAGVGLACAGLLSAVLPFGNWVSFRFRFTEGSDLVRLSTTGFGSLTSSEDGLETSTNDVEWLLGSIPDGLPAVLVGLALIVVGAVMAFSSIKPPTDPKTARTVTMGTMLAAPALAVAGLVWATLSYGKFAVDAYGDLEEGDDVTLLVTPGFGMFVMWIVLAAVAVSGGAWAAVRIFGIGGSKRAQRVAAPAPSVPGVARPVVPPTSGAR